VVHKWRCRRALGLPARGCALYRIPASSIAAAGGVAKWRPWRVDGGEALYRTPLNTTVPADLGGSVSIQALSIVRLGLVTTQVNHTRLKPVFNTILNLRRLKGLSEVAFITNLR
jgi:hypothetical protein